MEKFKDTGYVAQDIRLTQEKVGVVIIDTLYYSRGEEYEVKIKIFRVNHRDPNTCGDVVYEGNLADLIALVERP